MPNEEKNETALQAEDVKAEAERENDPEYDAESVDIADEEDYAEENRAEENQAEEAEEEPEVSNDEQDIEIDEEGNIITPEETVTEDDETEREPREPEGEDKEALLNEQNKNKELEKKLERLQMQARETLKSLGIESDDNKDTISELERIAAESEGKNVDDYRKARAEQEDAQEKKKKEKTDAIQKRIEEDMRQIREAFPEAADLKSFLDIPNVAEFCKYRDLGLSATKAYAAANAESIRANAEKAGKTKAQNSGKEHMKTVTGKSASDNSVRMTRSELAMFRDMFPGKSDKEIARIYKEVS